MSIENLTEFKHRIKKVREAAGLTREDFGKKLNVSGAYIGQMESGKKENPSKLFLDAVCSSFKVNSVWLDSGSGEMFQESLVDNVREIPAAFYGGAFKSVGVYSMAGAGDPNLLVHNDPIEEIVIPSSWYKSSITPVKVRGKSMEETINEGAYVGVDRDDKFVISGKVYAVWLPYEGAVIKRLYLDTEKITLKSDNPTFPDITISLQGLPEHFIQGRVAWVIQKL